MSEALGRQGQSGDRVSLHLDLIRLAGDPAVTSDRQLAALAGMTLPDLRELFTDEPDLQREILRADAQRARDLVKQALEAEKLSPAQLLALADARYGAEAKGTRSLFQDAADPSADGELEAMLEAGDPALCALLEQHGWSKTAR